MNAATENRMQKRTFEGKHVVVGITGGIAAYKAAELVSQLRQRGVFDVSNVEYAVLETSGDLTVILKPVCCAVTRGDLNINSQDVFSGMPLTLIDDGEINWKGMADHNLTRQWLLEQLQIQGIHDPQQVFFASLSNSGKLYVISRAEALQTKEKIH